MLKPTLDVSAGADAPSAELLFVRSRPRSRHAYWQSFGEQSQLFVVNGSRLYSVDAEVIEQLERSASSGDASVQDTLDRFGLFSSPEIDDTPLTSPPIHALSLAVAQKCNLGCTYCYARQGDFGGPAKGMSWETAQRAVELLLQGAAPKTHVNLAFLGGEPLANRAVLREATEYAADLAHKRDVEIGFSVTTNATLVTEEDADFFEKHGFAVTVSVDGLREDHDRQRPFKTGGGSFNRVMERAHLLLHEQKKMQVSARVTVTPGNLRLKECLEFFLKMGFHSVGFSPVLRSPTGHGEFSATDLAALLEAMVECGIEFERRAIGGERYAFSNIVNALHEIHRGTHRPYPCGAGAGYFGVSADGELAACHRFVGDTDGMMGTLVAGVDREQQNRWLAERHVHFQSPCRDCWARYLCGGGCHHEVIARGRIACDYIRGWLDYCLQAYARVSKFRPDWFQEPSNNGDSNRES
jgi:uncharacterized protein